MKTWAWIVVSSLIVTVTIVGIALIYISISGGPLSSEETRILGNLERQLSRGTQPIRVREIADRPWSRVCAFPPYIEEKSVRAALGATTSEMPSFNWSNNDGYKTLGFRTDSGSLVLVRIQRVLVAELVIPYPEPYVCADVSTGTVTVTREKLQDRAMIRLEMEAK